jgi:hypothetical protein
MDPHGQEQYPALSDGSGVRQFSIGKHKTASLNLASKNTDIQIYNLKIYNLKARMPK